MNLSIVVAVAENGIIGCNNGLPWHLPDDLKYFKSITTGKAIIMGRKTYESLGRPLPNRANIVLTRSRTWSAVGVDVVHTFDQAIQRAQAIDSHAKRTDGSAEPEIMVIGGAEVFACALVKATRLYLTRVFGAPVGDVHFPPYDPDDWTIASKKTGMVDKTGQPTHEFVILTRDRPQNP